MFNSQSASLEVICNAGDKILVNLYNGKPNESLNSKFLQKGGIWYVTQKPQIYPNSCCGKYHNLRVFYLIQQWKGSTETLDPEQWGWKKNEFRLVPV